MANSGKPVSYLTNTLDDRVIELLKAGGIGLMPADTIYGLSARALDEQAVERVHTLKRRDANKPCIVLISKPEQLGELGVLPPPKDITDKYWPGGLSIECDALKSPAWLHRGTHAFAVRLPNYPELQKLIDEVGPIISTSANLQGDPPINNVTEARQKFGESLNFYVDIGDLGQRAASTLIVIKDGRPQVVRQGALIIDEKEQGK